MYFPPQNIKFLRIYKIQIYEWCLKQNNILLMYRRENMKRGGNENSNKRHENWKKWQVYNGIWKYFFCPQIAKLFLVHYLNVIAKLDFSFLLPIKLSLFQLCNRKLFARNLFALFFFIGFVNRFMAPWLSLFQLLRQL